MENCIMTHDLRVMLVYPNLPLMMAPAMSMGIFNSIAKQLGCTVSMFETTQYSNEYNNRHIRMTEIGANRQNKKDELEDMFWIKNPSHIIPDFVDAVATFSPDLILMSIQEDVWKISTEILDSIAHLNIPHVLGGSFPSNSPDIVINHPSVTAIARHEGEVTVTEVIKRLQDNKSFDDVNGLWIKHSTGAIQKTVPAPLCNINDIIPDYDCFAGIRWRRPMGGKTFERAISMETFRGCPYNCAYCNSPKTRTMATDFNVGNFMRKKTIEQLEKELLHYIDLYDPDLIMFIDDSFLARPAREIFEFCDMWKKYKIPFWFNTRIDNCKPEYLAALKEAGVYRMTFGLESGNEQFRKNVLKRNVKNSKYAEYLEYINDSNIPYSLNVILGLPFETREMVLETCDVIHDAKGYDGLTISMFQPYWGTELRQVCVDSGFLPNSHINGWDSNELGGGYLDEWNLTMPAPYLQYNDVKQLVQTFALYAYFDKSMHAEVFKAETDKEKFDELFAIYQQEFFTDVQQGGSDRINNVCAMHDASSSYAYETVNEDNINGQ